MEPVQKVEPLSVVVCAALVVVLSCVCDCPWQHSDMPEEMRVETMELCVTACEKHATNNEVPATSQNGHPADAAGAGIWV